MPNYIFNGIVFHKVNRAIKEDIISFFKYLETESELFSLEYKIHQTKLVIECTTEWMPLVYTVFDRIVSFYPKIVVENYYKGARTTEGRYSNIYNS